MTKQFEADSNQQRHKSKISYLTKSAFQTIKIGATKTLSLFSALIIGIAIGLAPIWYNNYLNEPELVGRVIGLSSGEGYKNDKGMIVSRNMYTIFLSIGNKRDTPVSVIDYLLILNLNTGEKINCKPLYLPINNFTLGFKNFELEISKNSQYLLENTNTLITSDKPLIGFLSFSGDRKVTNYELNKVQIILYDAFGNEHLIQNNIEELRGGDLLPFLIEDMTPRPPSDSTKIN